MHSGLPPSRAGLAALRRCRGSALRRRLPRRPCGAAGGGRRHGRLPGLTIFGGSQITCGPRRWPSRLTLYTRLPRETWLTDLRAWSPILSAWSPILSAWSPILSAWSPILSAWSPILSAWLSSISAGRRITRRSGRKSVLVPVCPCRATLSGCEVVWRGTGVGPRLTRLPSSGDRVGGRIRLPCRVTVRCGGAGFPSVRGIESPGGGVLPRRPIACDLLRVAGGRSRRHVRVHRRSTGRGGDLGGGFVRLPAAEHIAVPLLVGERRAGAGHGDLDWDWRMCSSRVRLGGVRPWLVLGFALAALVAWLLLFRLLGVLGDALGGNQLFELLAVESHMLELLPAQEFLDFFELLRRQRRAGHQGQAGRQDDV